MDDYERNLNNLERGIYTMKLNYNVTEKERNFRFYKPTKLLRIVQEFVDSGETMAKVEIAEGEYKSVNSACSSLCKACQRFGKGLSCSIRDGVIYLYYKDN